MILCANLGCRTPIGTDAAILTIPNTTTAETDDLSVGQGKTWFYCTLDCLVDAWELREEG